MIAFTAERPLEAPPRSNYDRFSAQEERHRGRWRAKMVTLEPDEPAAEENIKIFKEKTGVADVQEVSAAFDIGIDAFKERIRAAVNDSSEKD